MKNLLVHLSLLGLFLLTSCAHHGSCGKGGEGGHHKKCEKKQCDLKKKECKDKKQCDLKKKECKDMKQCALKKGCKHDCKKGKKAKCEGKKQCSKTKKQAEKKKN
jgi:hypothetical protein